MKKSIIGITAACVGVLGLKAEEKMDQAALVAIGKQNFATCMACHGADGKGLQMGDKLMAPSYVDSPIVNGDPQLLARVLLKGIEKTDQAYLGMMAGLEALLSTDEQLAGVMTYLRTDFGNASEVVTPAQAKELRTALEGAAPITRAEIDAALASQETQPAKAE